MKSYRVLTGFCIRAGEDVNPGDVVTFTTPAEAAAALACYRVVEVVEAGEVPASAAPSGEPVVETARRRR